MSGSMFSASEWESLARKLEEDNAQLRDEVRAIHVRPLPPREDPGYQMWQAMMEDARGRGEVNLSVRAQMLVTVDWAPA